MATKNLRLNEEIRVNEVRLIDSEGEQKGVVATSIAKEMAREVGLDLVEISPNAKPPVCKILDYGKYKYEQEKRIRDSKKKQTLVKMKEVRMQPKIDTHDLQFKTKHIHDFLKTGAKVKVTIRFRGRELAHTELGKVVLDNINSLLDEKEAEYSIDKPAKMEGKCMSMILSPKTKKKK